MIIALISFFATGYRERKREKIRVQKSTTHVITWIDICMKNLLIAAQNVQTSHGNLPKGILKAPKPPKLPFNEITDIDKIDLTEVFIIKARDRSTSVFKLNQVHKIRHDLENEFTDFKTTFSKLIESYNEKQMFFKDGYTYATQTLQIYSEETAFSQLIKGIGQFSYSITDIAYAEKLYNEYVDALAENSTIIFYTGNLGPFKDFKITFGNWIRKNIEIERYLLNVEYNLLTNANKLNLIAGYYEESFNETEFYKGYKEKDMQKLRKLYDMIKKSKSDRIYIS